MKSRTPLIALITAGSMMLAGSLLAQDQTMPPPPPSETMPATAPTPPPPPGGTQAQVSGMQGQQGTINSVVPPVAAGPAPSFEQLSGGSRYITEDQASAYPLLANDFAYVDKGKTGHITKAQYERWLNGNK
ncbi:hypothetical protein [Dyella sp. C9]|uniref:hypothetical protein n=1 Tax=Dyella sp. C9 TaxID=2202154 RepID=UPI000DEEC639|nr:hypothetical protein [Dyella sp. C9]